MKTEHQKNEKVLLSLHQESAQPSPFLSILNQLLQNIKWRVQAIKHTAKKMAQIFKEK